MEDDSWNIGLASLIVKKLKREREKKIESANIGSVYWEMNWPTEVLILNEKCTTHHLYFKSHKVKMRERLETCCWSNLWHWSRLIHFYFFFHSFFSLSLQKQDVQHQYGNAGGKCSWGKWRIPLLLWKEKFNSLAVDDVTH